MLTGEDGEKGEIARFQRISLSPFLAVNLNVTLPQAIIRKLNHRQLWFMGELQRGVKVNACNIAATEAQKRTIR